MKLSNAVPLYLEDFHVGDYFETASVVMTKEDIISFATHFDPQHFHLDQETAKDSLFNGLAASGWHTNGVSMRLIVQSGLNIINGIIGLGVDEVRWPKPVRPNDSIYVRGDILEVIPSNSKPEWGVVKIRWQTFNQHHEVVASMLPSLWVKRRDAV